MLYKDIDLELAEAALVVTTSDNVVDMVMLVSGPVAEDVTLAPVAV
jgi:hypothetical protein